MIDASYTSVGQTPTNDSELVVRSRNMCLSYPPLRSAPVGCGYDVRGATQSKRFPLQPASPNHCIYDTYVSPIALVVWWKGRFENQNMTVSCLAKMDAIRVLS